jgi:predicted anti-sigma-YlaC factor YlaD
MNCREFHDSLNEYKQGKPIGNGMVRVREHLRTCDACRSGLKARDLVEILPAFDSSVEPSDDFSARFYAELESRAGRKTSGSQVKTAGRRVSWLSGGYLKLAAAGVMILLVSAGIYFRDVSRVPDTSAVFYEIEVTENLEMLKDMALLEDLEFFEDMDAIESLSQHN